MPAPRSVEVAQRLVLSGVLLAGFAVPVVFTPGLGSGFGPAKAALLAVSVLAILSAAALDGSLARDALALLRTSRIAQAGAALLALAFVSTAFSADLRAAVAGSYPDYRGLLSLVAFSLVGLAAAVLTARELAGGSRFTPLILRSSAVSLLAITTVSLAEKTGLPPATMKLEGAIRTIATAGNASNLGVVCCLLLPLAAGAALIDRSARWRAAALVAAFGGVLAAVWTLSRGAWLGLLAAAVVAALLTVVARRMRAAGSPKRSGPHASPTGRSAAMTGAALAAALVIAVASMPQTLPRAARLLETGSATAQWRLQTWRGTLVMVGDHGLVGVGPNGFRAAFLDYKQSGADDGRLGYLPTESSHNAVLDTTASFGLGGLFVLAAFAGLAGVAVHARLRSNDPEPAIIFSAALVGASTALLFHYATLDSGPLFALLLGTMAAWPPTPRLAETPSNGRAPLRGVTYSVAVVWALVAMAAVALLVADGLSGLAARRASTGGPWQSASNAAVAAASWEPAIHRAAGRAAAIALRSEGGPAVEPGARAYARSLELAPNDPALLVEAARFELAAAAALRDEVRVARAEALLQRAAELDPAAGIPVAELGRLALAQKEPSKAVPLLARAVELSPAYATAWSDLAEAFRLTGDTGGADAAARTAAELR